MFSGTIAPILTLVVIGAAAFLTLGNHLPAMLALGIFATRSRSRSSCG